jgi:hypothetical protein
MKWFVIEMKLVLLIQDLYRMITRITTKTSESEEISAILDDVLDKFEK